MNYSIIIEPRNGIWRALIPTLPNLSAEGVSRDDALRKARTAAETYLAGVEVFEVTKETTNFRASHPQAWLRTEPLFPDDELFRQHLAEIDTEKDLQRQEAEREATLMEVV